jgi:hypothetical protein
VLSILLRLPLSLAHPLLISSRLHKGAVRAGAKMVADSRCNASYLTATPSAADRSLIHLPPPGTTPGVRGEWQLGEGAVQCTLQNGETDPSTFCACCCPLLSIHLASLDAWPGRGGEHTTGGGGGRHGLRGGLTSHSPAHSPQLLRWKGQLRQQITSLPQHPTRMTL